MGVGSGQVRIFFFFLGGGGGGKCLAFSSLSASNQRLN